MARKLSSCLRRINGETWNISDPHVKKSPQANGQVEKAKQEIGCFCEESVLTIRRSEHKTYHGQNMCKFPPNT